MIRTRFLRAELAKIMNGVPDSAAARHMETYNERKLVVSNYRKRIWLSKQILCAGGDILGSFESRLRRDSPLCLKPDFFTARYQPDDERGHLILLLSSRNF
jgi:hypothetical protein